eukprot:TRINITY_DN7986_c0_g2_i1.p1 TRINITY_DN7986_c0_g2~~TRINITY_DN7986_c0_g2_i1.p1  ORF type:complete len:859 (-),score=140.23 TRINITY_DN7986_c0_g2_i1:66-2642(-)
MAQGDPLVSPRADLLAVLQESLLYHEDRLSDVITDRMSKQDKALESLVVSHQNLIVQVARVSELVTALSSADSSPRRNRSVSFQDGLTLPIPLVKEQAVVSPCGSERSQAPSERRRKPEWLDWRRKSNFSNPSQSQQSDPVQAVVAVEQFGPSKVEDYTDSAGEEKTNGVERSLSDEDVSCYSSERVTQPIHPSLRRGHSGNEAARSFAREEELRKQRAETVSRASLRDPEIILDFEQRSCAETVKHFVKSAKFDTIFAVFIILNAGYIGLHVEMTRLDAEGKPLLSQGILELGQHFFSFVFIIELACRLFGYGFKEFFSVYNRDWAWNILDCGIIGLSVAEVLLEWVFFFTDAKLRSVSIVRLIRFLRIMKIVRIIRIMRFFRSLRILITSIFSTLKSLVWAMVLLCIIMYLFAIIFASAVNTHLTVEFMSSSNKVPEYDSPPTEDQLLYHYLGSVPRAGFSLFKSITGGTDWEVIVLPLASISWIYVGLFIFYVVFGLFAVLNVVTGVFCQGAIESAEHDQDEVIEMQLNVMDQYTSQLKMLFLDIDDECSGSITLGAFERYIQDARVKAYFRSLDLHVHEAWSLFKLIDKDKTNVIEIDDFVDGCLRMRGAAKSLEVNEMMYQNKWMMDKIADLIEEIEDFMDGIMKTPLIVPGGRTVASSPTSSPTSWTGGQRHRRVSRTTSHDSQDSFSGRHRRGESGLRGKERRQTAAKTAFERAAAARPKDGAMLRSEGDSSAGGFWLPSPELRSERETTQCSHVTDFEIPCLREGLQGEGGIVLPTFQTVCLRELTACSMASLPEEGEREHVNAEVPEEEDERGLVNPEVPENGDDSCCAFEFPGDDGVVCYPNEICVDL